MVGRTVSHYRILDKLGEGGMGIVYRAEDTRLHRTVALKILHPAASQSPETKARLFREAEIAAALDHPNISTVYEIDEADGLTFLAMAFVEGETLSAKIERRPLPLDEVLDISSQMAEAMGYAHQKLVVHRDIKPSNVMITGEGRVKVMDFGLAHLAGQTHITRTGAILGTPAYMSPEQVRGQETDARSDIWAFGVVIYEMLTGRQPFGGDNTQAVMYSIINAQPEPITALRVGVPAEFDRIVGKAVAKVSSDRYQHVDEMGVDLRAARRRLASTSEPWAEEAASVEPAVGRVLDHYRLEEKLGEGGMGTVYRAADTHLDRPVAIKVLRSHATANEERKRRFVQEAKAASALNHPNIVTIHDISTDGGTDFIVMENVAGQTLDQEAARGLSIEETLARALQITDALAAAHDAGIIHRDIKPANIMVTKSGHVKVLDFGLAKLSDDVTPEATVSSTTLTKEGAVVGTVAYMSPEQARGKPVDARTDIFAVGVVLYEALSGRRPFQGTSELAILSAILSEPPPPLKKVQPNLPPGLDRIVMRCLEKDRGLRYSSIAELRKDLTACQSRLVSPGLWDALRKPRYAVPALLLLLVVMAAVTRFAIRSYRVNWARTEAIPEIARLLDDNNFDGAFRLGQEAEHYIPGDPELLDLQRHYAVPTSVVTTPPGADVYVKGYTNLDSDWIHLGQTPLEDTPVPGHYLRWRIARDGFTPTELAFHGYYPIQATLHRPEDTPPGMVPVSGGPFQFRSLRSVELGEYWLDKYEVTNRQFKEFVDQGAYTKPEYWQHDFVNDSRTLSWEQAMEEFRDATGRPGPSTWRLGAFPDGREDYPVDGVSWYEAAAYAEFAGKSLPTVFHWYHAVNVMQFTDIVRYSNFNGKGPVQIGGHQGLSPFGGYDMAGNVREWCWNQTSNDPGSKRFILGGSWAESQYMFYSESNAVQPFDRSATNGFRCAKFEAPLTPDLGTPIDRVSRDYSQEEPVSDEVFAVYRQFYSYEPSALNVEEDAVDDSAAYWRRETVSFDAAYGNERVIAHLFLPRNADPPYQTVVYFPSVNGMFATSSEQLEMFLMEFLPRIGRAVLYPVYKGMYERNLGAFRGIPKDLVVSWSRDFSRSIDYLETRPDIDHEKLAYYGYSTSTYGLMLATLDPRIRVNILMSGGLFLEKTAPEADPLNFAPRSLQPTLMLTGRNDFISPVETTQRPLLRLLGTPENEKRLVLFDTGHVVYLTSDVIKEILDWLDRFLGPVTTRTSATE